MYVHPELVEVLEALPERPADPYADIAATRASFRALLAPAMAKTDARVLAERIDMPGPVGNAIGADVIRPAGGAAGPRPAVVYLHGGGFAYGELDGPSPFARDIAAAADAVVVAPDYRLAPEHRFPAGLEDCYETLCFAAEHSAELGVDPERIAVAGASAGACLSAAVCLMARDRGGPRIAYQSLLIPLLDDRGDTPSARALADLRIINGPGVQRTWDNYLGADRDPAVTSPYAAPARASDLRGLPPALVLTCGLDPLRDEGLRYAIGLAQADVPVTMHHVPGAWHLFEAYAPDSALARRTTTRWLAELRDALTAPAAVTMAG